MAERERQTNKERRAAAREERKRREAEAAAKAKRARARNAGITAVVVVLVGLVVFQAVRPDGNTLEDAILISSEDAEAAREAAGCEVLAEREPLPERYHFEAAAAPDADTIYTGVRPTHSGPHNIQTSQVGSNGFERQIDERSSTHNLEHGSVIVWWDPAQVEDPGPIRDWTELLNDNGFYEPVQVGAGAGIMSAPFEDPGISSGKAVAFRAWGTAMDCDTFDETVANAFVAENFGTRGIGPESTLGGYPDGVLEFEDREVEEVERNDPDTDLAEDGAMTDGETADEEAADGGTTDGETADEEAADGGTTDGNAADGEAADGATTDEG